MIPQLLVSVRSVAEAESAALGGADVVDIKEPTNGPLGRANAETIRRICESITRRFPDRLVTAALGESREWTDEALTRDQSLLISFLCSGDPGPGYLKLGLAGALSTRPANFISTRFTHANSLGADSSGQRSRNAPESSPPYWQQHWRRTQDRIGGLRSDGPQVADPSVAAAVATPSRRWIAVAYADHVRADSPGPEVIIDAATESGCSGILIDTFVKDDSGLRDWLAPEQLQQIRQLTENAGLWLAVAGRVSLLDLPALREVRPNLIAVRGAVCEQGTRTNAVQQNLVRRFADAIADTFAVSNELNSDRLNQDRVKPVSPLVSPVPVGLCRLSDPVPRDPEFHAPEPSRLRLP